MERCTLVQEADGEAAVSAPQREQPPAIDFVKAEPDTGETADTETVDEARVTKTCLCCSRVVESTYTCPVCCHRICSLPCYRKHQADGCPGRWESTRYAFVPPKSYDLDQLLRDYAFLEDLSRLQQGHGRQFQELVSGVSPESSSRVRNSTTSRAQRKRLTAVERAASKRGIRFQLLPEIFSKHRRNTSVYRPETDCIEWRLECHVCAHERTVDEQVRVLERCPEHVHVAQVLERLCLREMAENTELYGVYLRPDRANQPRIPIQAPYEIAVADVLRAAECVIEFPSLEVTSHLASGDETIATMPTWSL
ncbi:hypothetical protein CCYA_CCYA15G3877 [Cyanidiococcus yangmingshanensis]|nr:hypothetical protein CCYA_CCYA15G3877 [Cyanidiococcus yangmingshanensis]